MKMEEGELFVVIEAQQHVSSAEFWRAAYYKAQAVVAKLNKEHAEEIESLCAENDAVRKRLREVCELLSEPGYTRKAKTAARTGIRNALASTE